MKKSLVALISLAALALLCAPKASAFNLNMTHDPVTGYSLTWNGIQPSTDDAKVTYYVYQAFGRNGVPNEVIYDGGFLSPTSAYITTRETSVTIDPGPGSRCFVVISTDDFSGETQSSDYECHGFIHHLQEEAILRADGDGSQRGMDQEWTFTYSLDEDAYFTANIYPPGTQFTTNSDGFIISASSPVVNTLVDYTPRTGEMAGHNVVNGDDKWDSRNSTGAIVPNGIYYLVLKAWLDSGYFSVGNIPETYIGSGVLESFYRGSGHWSIPVDILRIIDLQATGISLSDPTSRISYLLTGDATVRVVIAQPGSGFAVDVNGDVQPKNVSTGLIDSTLIVSTFSFYRKSGTNNEAWDGISSTGAVMPSGVYQLGISARDAYGNKAIDNSGNDYPIFTQITLERTSGSDSGTTVVTDTVDPTISSISPLDGAVLSGAVSTITVVLTDTGGSQLNLGGCDIRVTDPNGVTIGRTLSNNGTDTLYAALASPQTTNGTYRVYVDAIDTSGNSASYELSFTIFIGLSQGDFERSFIIYPNPAKNSDVTIQFDLTIDSTVEIEIFNLLGERVYYSKTSEISGTAVTKTWNVRNSSGKKVGSGVYLVKIKASGGNATVKTIKKLVVIQ